MARFDPDILPAAALAQLNAGGRIGLLGGSFNPAHEAHFHISLIALRRLKLDAVLWIVSPQNPLKSELDMAPLAKRIEQARTLVTDPRIHVASLEQAFGTHYTIDTIAEPLRECHRQQLGHLPAAELNQLVTLLRAARLPHEPDASTWK